MTTDRVEYPDTRLLAEMQAQWENQQKWIEQATNAISGNETLKKKHTCLCNLTDKAKGYVDNDVLDYIDRHSPNMIVDLSKYRLSPIAEFLKVCGNRLTEKCIAFKVQGYGLNATLYLCKYTDVLNAVTILEQAYKYNRVISTRHAITDDERDYYFSTFPKVKDSLFLRFGIEVCGALTIKYDTFRKEIYKPWEDLKFIPDEAERYLHTCKSILLFLALRNEVTLVEEEMKLYEEPFTPYAQREDSPSTLQSAEASQENAEADKYPAEILMLFKQDKASIDAFLNLCKINPTAKFVAGTYRDFCDKGKALDIAVERAIPKLYDWLNRNNAIIGKVNNLNKAFAQRMK